MKNIMIYFWLCSSMALLSFVATAQNARVQLLDAEESSIITNAYFQYGKQSGVSDAEGWISFTVAANTYMNISHINYGDVTLSPAEVSQMVEEQKLKLTHNNLSLKPATIIALRKVPTTQITLGYQDNLAHDGAELLTASPAIGTIQKGGNYGFDPVFRGFKYEQLNVVMDGAQAASAACPNRMDPPSSQMAPNMLDRVEILKGPHALRYGAGLGATINFIPTSLTYSDTSQWHGRLSSAYESNGNIWRNEGKIAWSNRAVHASLFSAWAEGGDYKAGNGTSIPAGFSRGSFGTQLGWAIDEKQELKLSALYNRARDAAFPALPMDLREDDTWMLNAQHRINFGGAFLKSWHTTAYASIVNHKMDNLLKPLDPRMMNASTDAATNNIGFRSESLWDWKNNTLYAGLDYRYEDAEGIRNRTFLMGPMAGNTISDNAWQDSRIHRTALFAEYQRHWGDYQWVVAGRLEVNQASAEATDSDFTQWYGDISPTQINPSISTGIQKQLPHNMQIGAWIGRTQRSASIAERYINYFPIGLDPYEMLGNPDLAPEANHQLDLVWSWKKKHTALQVDVFGAYIQDYITSYILSNATPTMPNSPGVRQFTNINGAVKVGFEALWSQELAAGLHHQMSVAYTYAQDAELDAPLPEIPPMDMRYTLTGKYWNGKIMPSITFRQVLRQNRISSEFGETETAAFSLLNAKISYRPISSLQVHLGADNLFDVTYYEHLNRSVRGMNTPIYAPGRNIFVSASWMF